MKRSAVTGLLVVCVLLAAGLALTAYFNYRAANRAAQDVLLSRAIEIGAGFASTARLAGAMRDDQKLGQLAAEMAQGEVALAVVALDGRIVAAAPAEQASSPDESGLTFKILEELRLQGQAYRLVERQFLEVWRPLRGPRGEPGGGPPGPGRGGGRRWWRRMKQHLPEASWPSAPDGRAAQGKGETTGRAGDSPEKSGPPQPDRVRSLPPFRGKGPGMRPPWPGARRARLLRIRVGVGLTEPLTRPAELILSLTAVVSLILLSLGVFLHRAAARAQRAEQQLQRRNALAALGEMAAVLAHEIRTPLGSIKGNAQLLGESLPDDDRVDSMVSEAARLERLVNGLLDYARPAEPQRRPCDPDQLLRRSADLVAPKAVAGSVNLITDPAECGPCLLGDPDQLLQVLVNLLQNAVEATASADATGDLVSFRARKSAGNVVFSVQDSGPGLAGADPEKIFRPFYTQKKQGSGLGLSIARQIVQQHGGTLNLRERGEGGVLATVTLPLRGPS